MSCEHFKPALVGLLYGEIDSEERGAVEAHLHSCAACRAEADSLAETSRQLVDAHGELPPAPVILLPAEARGVSRGRVGWWLAPRRLAAAAALLVAGPLVVLAGANTRIERDNGRWAARFSLLPERVAPMDEEVIRQVRRQIESDLTERLRQERQATLETLDARLRDSRETLVRDLSSALARQEESLRAGQRMDRQEMLRRDRAVEQLVGSEMSRTREWLGEMLNASYQPVVEQ